MINTVKAGVCEHCQSYSSVLFLVCYEDKELNVCPTCIRESLRGKFKYVGGTKRQQLSSVKKRVTKKVFTEFVEKGSYLRGRIDSQGVVRCSVVPYSKIQSLKKPTVKQWRWSFFYGLHVYNGDFVEGDREKVVGYLEKVYKLNTSNLIDGYKDIERLRSRMTKSKKPTFILNPDIS